MARKEEKKAEVVGSVDRFAVVLFLLRIQHHSTRSHLLSNYYYYYCYYYYSYYYYPSLKLPSLVVCCKYCIYIYLVVGQQIAAKLLSVVILILILSSLSIIMFSNRTIALLSRSLLSLDCY